MKQWIRGSRIGESAKESDALLRTLGLISSICFVELKRHDVDVLKADDYRSDCWQISSELAGAVGQVQKVVQLAVETIGNELKIEDSDGYETGEQAFLYQPKAFVIIGTLDEFRRDGQVSREKFGSFELFRRHLTNPEIITFDELLERARHIVEHGRSGLQCGPAPVEDAESFWDDDVPF